jgi:[CysO sulfur-carrier protein]-S-L-cysteine hydrolase
MQVLSEEQIQRYSRAILLAGVGGRGQLALLATGARLTAGGPALLTAAAYLAAGGTPVQGPPGTLGVGDAGFLISASEFGQPAEATVRQALQHLNPDAAVSAVRQGTLAALPLADGLPRPLVAVGRRAGAWVLWAATAEACEVCLAEAVRGAEPPGGGPEAVQAGALAAFLFQRLLLGFAPPLCGVRMAKDGSLETLAPVACTHGTDIPEAVLAEAVRHLEGCYPEEGCGVVLHGPAGGARWVALANAYADFAARDPAGFPRDARSAFLFEPQAWLALLREAEGRGERVTYLVHAHPDGQAALSAEDVAQAAPGGLPLLPGVGYLVVAVRQGRATAAGCARWAGKGFREAALRLPSSAFS